MTTHCPYLQLATDGEHASPRPSKEHRCRVRFQLERIGLEHQTKTCLTTEFSRCPRLVAFRSAEGVPPGRPSSPHLESVASQRRPVFVEVVVLALCASLVLAWIFVGYALYRYLRHDTRLEVAPVAAVASETPTSVPPGETPVPATPSPMPLHTATVMARPAASPTATAVPPTATPTPTLPGRTPATSPPTRLVIPRIGLDIPVLSVGIETVMENGQTRLVWGEVANAGGFHEASAYPGNAGNTVINGHRDIKGAVFRRMDRVKVGDEIILYADGMTYGYRVSEIVVVPEKFASAERRAENLKLIGYLPEERLTLVTCTPVSLATHRLLVIAEPADLGLPQMPEAGSDGAP